MNDFIFLKQKQINQSLKLRALHAAKIDVNCIKVQLDKSCYNRFKESVDLGLKKTTDALIVTTILRLVFIMIKVTQK